MRKRDVTEIARSDGITLVSGDGNDIYKVNRIGRAVWELLREPASVMDAVDVLAEAFPLEPRQKIIGDMVRLFEELAWNRLIEPIS